MAVLAPMKNPILTNAVSSGLEIIQMNRLLLDQNLALD